MSKIETGRWSDQLRRMLGMAGAAVVASELSPEISPTIQLEGPTAEWAFLKNVRLAATGTRVTAGAATFLSFFRLRNQAGSGVLAVINLIDMWFDTAAKDVIIVHRTPDANIGGILETAVRDGRWAPTGVSQRNALILSSTNSAAAVAAGEPVLRAWSGDANAVIRYDTPLVLLPGESVDGGSLSDQTQFSTAIAWTERGIPELEL